MKQLITIMFLIMTWACYAGLTVITGPMFSGKSLELIRMGKMFDSSCMKVFIGKHCLDGKPEIISRGTETRLPAVLLSSAADLEEQIQTADIVLLDEVQFFDAALVNVVRKFIFRRKSMIVAGLDMDYRGMPFGDCMPSLCAMATQVIKLKAKCHVCSGMNAIYSQRLQDGIVVPATGPTVVLEGSENVTYQARCMNCYKVSE